VSNVLWQFRALSLDCHDCMQEDVLAEKSANKTANNFGFGSLPSLSDITATISSVHGPLIVSPNYAHHVIPEIDNSRIIGMIGIIV